MENKEKFYGFLKGECPEKGCMVCSVKEKSINALTGEEREVTNYYIIEKHKISNGNMFIINGRFWYEYEWLFDLEWKILFKHYEE